jgi:pentatricopeptide repeat protein
MHFTIRPCVYAGIVEETLKKDEGIKIRAHASMCESVDLPSTSQEDVRSVLDSGKSDEALQMMKGMSTTTIDDLRYALQKFVGKRSVKGIRGVEELAIQLGAPGKQERKAVELWFDIIAAYGRMGKLKSASRCFKAARIGGVWTGKEKDIVLTNKFLHALHSDVKLAFIRARQFLDEGTCVDVSSFNVLLKACMRQGDTRRARLVLSWMMEQRIHPDNISYSTLVKTFSYAGNFDGVLYVIDLMDINGYKPSDEVFSNLLIACGNAGQHDTAWMIWKNIVRSRGEKNIPVSLYEAMILSCNSVSQGDRSLELLELMKSNGVPPSVKAYNLALSACRAQPGRRARPVDLINAMNIFSEMKTRHLSLDQFTYGQLIEICAESSQGQMASWLHRAMEVEGVKANAIVYTSFIKALIRSDMIDDAMEKFRLMVWGPARLKPTGATFRTLAKELRERGHIREALQIYASMRKAKFAPNNIEFQKLIAAAAEAAFSQGDAGLQTDVAELCGVSSMANLDLHGRSRYEARAAVLCVLGMIATEYKASKREPETLVIIVGRGGHSIGNEPILPNVVLKMLTEELRLPLLNDQDKHQIETQMIEDGRIIVDASVLTSWLQLKRC